MDTVMGGEALRPTTAGTPRLLRIVGNAVHLIVEQQQQQQVQAESLKHTRNA